MGKFRGTWSFLLAGHLAAAVVFALPALASDSPADRATLRGLKEIHVTVEPLNPEVEKDGLTSSQLQFDIEARLKKAGIAVISNSAPYFLYVDANLMKVEGLSGVYVFNILVSLQQPVGLIRSPDVSILASTWDVATIGLTPIRQFKSFREDLLGPLVDKFINAYLAENPK
jgi:hypothetical protein